MAHSDKFFIQVRPLDIEQHGIYAALILGYLATASALFGSKTNGKFYQSIKDIADIIGVGLTTMKKYLPTEEMGWKHYAGYKPGTMEKTTWWEPCDPSEPTPDGSSTEGSADGSSNINKNIKRVNGRTVASLPSPARTPSDFPCGGENGEAAQQEGGVVKITTPPTVVDLQKKQTATAKRKKEFEFCQELMARMGITGVKVGGVFHKRIMQLKAQGYDDEALRMVAEEAKVARLKDDFYAEPMKAFSESGVSGLLAKREAKKQRDPLLNNWDFQV